MTVETSRLELRLDTPKMTVLAGDSTQQTLSLVNMTALPDNFDLSIEGLPAGWYSFSNPNVNLFPNWSGAVGFKVEISPKIRPNVYTGKIIATSRSQPGVNTKIEIQIEVLAPLKLEARLQPRRASGYQANYNLILRNRSTCEGELSLQLSQANPYCLAQFNPPRLRIGPRQSQNAKLKVRLASKTPKDQAAQLQTFEIQVLSSWYVNQQLVNMPPLLVEGEYQSQSRWMFVKRHPLLFGLVFGLLALVIIWFVLQLLISNAVVAVADQTPQTVPPAVTSLRYEQKEFTDKLQSYIPLVIFVRPKVEFSEQSNDVGVTTVSFNFLSFNLSLKGQVKVDPAKGLVFVAENRSKLSQFPWNFLPVDRVVAALGKRIGGAAKTQNLALDRAEVEGNTLFIRLKPCSGTAACG
jgi:hypothetical protein